MLAIQSSLRWLIGGIAELYSLPLTVMGPASPLRTTSIARCLLFIRDSDLARGGKRPGTPSPSGWWQTAHAALNSASPAASWFFESGAAGWAGAAIRAGGTA